jgi:hypothetical protein
MPGVPVTHALVEQCCELLATYPELRSLRLGFPCTPAYPDALDAAHIARASHLRCWISGHNIVLETENEGEPLRIDRRGRGRIVPRPDVNRAPE